MKDLSLNSLNSIAKWGILPFFFFLVKGTSSSMGEIQLQAKEISGYTKLMVLN